jgi:23S rRNA (guanosine2251-2'-O)-methyltransferase
VSETRLIHGFHAVAARLRQRPEGVREIYLLDSRRDGRARDLVRLAEAAAVRVIAADARRLEGLVAHGRHQGVVARVSAAMPQLRLDELLDDLAEPALLLVLDGVQDPHNLGACLRVAEAAGAHAVVAPRDRAVGLTASAIKVASGAAEALPYIIVTNLARTLRELKDKGVWTVGAEAGAPRPLYAVDMKGPLAWVLGAEGTGLRRLTRETCDETARIPMRGGAESLNVSVASGICLFEARRQRDAA